MNDDDSKPSEKISADYEVELEFRVRKERSLARARRTGMYTANLTMAAIAVSLGIAAQMTILMELMPANQILGTFCCFSLSWVIFVLPMGSAAGWLAHRIFFETMIPVPRMAIAFALIAVLSVFGWILVMTAQ
jgi:hypothetical protein